MKSLNNLNKKYSLNIEGKLLDLSMPIVMGIINLTPDSFYDGGKLKSDHEILDQAEKMLSAGAKILDIGGYSSKPGADKVTSEEEIQRVSESIACISKALPESIISIDTFRGDVAKAALNSGAKIINDISSGEIDPSIIEIAASSQVPYIAMHMRGTPQNMQEHTKYDHVLNDILDYFQHKVDQLRNAGIKDIIIDPGFGFSKTLKQNYELLGGLELFQVLEVPILVGASRKSMIYNILGTDPSKALNGTTVVNTISLQKGANILRVHDVKEAVETIKIIQEIPN